MGSSAMLQIAGREVCKWFTCPNADVRRLGWTAEFPAHLGQDIDLRSGSKKKKTGCVAPQGHSPDAAKPMGLEGGWNS